MNVIVNYPTSSEGKLELEDKIAEFHAELLLETIDKEEILDKTKKEILNNISNELKQTECKIEKRENRLNLLQLKTT